MARLHVLQAFGVTVGARRREFIRGIVEVDDDDINAITGSNIGASLLASGLLRVIEDSEPSKTEARTEAPKKTRKRKPKPSKDDDASAPADDNDDPE